MSARNFRWAKIRSELFDVEVLVDSALADLSSLVHIPDGTRGDPSPGPLFDDALATNGVRASGRKRPIQDRDADGCLSLLSGETACPQPRSDQRLVAAHRRFDERPLSIVCGILPGQPPFLRDHLKMSITLLCGGQKSPSQPWRPLPTLDATYPPAPHYASGSRTRHHASPRATPSAVLEHSSELIGCPISRSLTTCCVCLELRSLPSTGVTRFQRYCEPLRHPHSTPHRRRVIRQIIF